MRTLYYSFIMCCCLSVSLQVLGLSREDSLSKYDKLDSSEIIAASFTYKVGEQELGQGAILCVPDGYRLLDARQSRLLAENIWGNPEDPNMLGVLLPPKTAPTDKDFSGFVISFEPSGHLDEQEAGKINYSRLLYTMKEELKNYNVLRSRHGEGAINSMDWAFPPYFDKKNHSLHWARVLHFADKQPAILNYEVRFLSRSGALCFTAVGKPTDMARLRKQMELVTAAARFSAGNSYTDFNPRTDVAAQWTPEITMVSTSILSVDKILSGLRSILLTVLVSLCMVLFVYVMQYYHHHRRKPTYRKMIDERLN